MELTFTTKYDLGQKAVALDIANGKLKDIEISEIQFETDGCEAKFWYRDKQTRELFKEKYVYQSREEFIAQL